MSTDLLHWHKTGDGPSSYGQPTPCCADHFGTVLEQAHEAWARDHSDDLDAERRRVVLQAVSSIRLYADAAMSVREGAEAALIDTVASKAIEAVKRTGCICHRIEISSFGGEPIRTLPDFDSRCGMHGIANQTDQHQETR
jgi:hypothetical protein